MYTHSLLYVLDNAVTQSTSRKTAAGRLIALCTYLQPWRGTASVLQSLLFKHVLYAEDVTNSRSCQMTIDYFIEDG